MSAEKNTTQQLTPAEMEMALAARRRYMREYKRRYYREHPERQHEANMKYWLKKAQREAEGGADRGGD